MTATTMNKATAKRREYPSYLADYAREYGKLDGDGRQKEWDRLIGWSVELVCRMAVLLSEREKSGDDLSDFRRRFPDRYNWLKRIADGRILPELMYHFPTSAQLSRVASLPTAKQREIVERGNIEVAVRSDGGQWARRMISLSDLTPPLLRQAISSSGERTFEQQIAYAEGRTLQQTPVRRSEMRIDHRSGGVWIKGEFITRAELARLVEELDQGKKR